MSLENNNNNKNDRKQKKSLYQIMDKQGFYIILILCVGIVAATALWVDNQGNYFIGEGPTNPFEEDMQPEVTLVEDNTTPEQETNEAQETGKIGQGKPIEENTKTSEVKEETTGSEKKEVQSNTTKTNDIATEKQEATEEVEDTATVGPAQEVSAKTSMMVPVVGEIILPFAEDHLVFHKTLDQWSTHKGIDIKAKEGTPVKAALDGEVVEVINDTIEGIAITLKHEDDLYTRYSNLSTDVMVKVGQKITKGDTISGVGKTASNKSLEGPLLHFQVLIDDKFVDPQIYLSK